MNKRTLLALLRVFIYVATRLPLVFYATYTIWYALYDGAAIVFLLFLDKIIEWNEDFISEKEILYTSVFVSWSRSG